MFAGCGSATRRDLLRISAASDPISLTLEPGFNPCFRSTTLADNTEVGIIKCRDGSSARFWFRSHHLTGDKGGTLFRLSDGEELFMSGYFCCEVQLPEQAFASLDGLRAFVRKYDGTSP